MAGEWLAPDSGVKGGAEATVDDGEGAYGELREPAVDEEASDQEPSRIPLAAASSSALRKHIEQWQRSLMATHGTSVWIGTSGTSGTRGTGELVEGVGTSSSGTARPLPLPLLVLEL